MFGFCTFSGKTVVLNCVVSACAVRGVCCLAVASSGVAALSLIGGRTAHSRFQIPVGNDLSDRMCNISKQSALAKVLQRVRVIIWDETTMVNRACVECLDRTLRDIRNHDVVFGGVTMVFGGDFRQVLCCILFCCSCFDVCLLYFSGASCCA